MIVKITRTFFYNLYYLIINNFKKQFFIIKNFLIKEIFIKKSNYKSDNNNKTLNLDFFIINTSIFTIEILFYYYK